MPGAGYLAAAAFLVAGQPAARAAKAVRVGRAALSPGERRAQEGAAEENAGSGFFEGCLRKGRGSSPDRYRLWRNGIWEAIRKMMPQAGTLGIEPMYRLAQVSKRQTVKRQPVSLEGVTPLQPIFCQVPQPAESL